MRILEILPQQPELPCLIRVQFAELFNVASNLTQQCREHKEATDEDNDPCGTSPELNCTSSRTYFELHRFSWNYKIARGDARMQLIRNITEHQCFTTGFLLFHIDAMYFNVFQQWLSIVFPMSSASTFSPSRVQVASKKSNSSPSPPSYWATTGY